MRVLDLFCGAGGAAMGYHRAGFTEIIGIDINPQPRYPFTFFRANVLSLSITALQQYDLIHASPPCQAYSVTRHSHNKQHPELVEPVRQMLQESGVPYVIENVPGAPLIEPITLCGAQFALEALDIDGEHLYLKRHRLFETSFPLTSLGCCCAAPKAKGYLCGGVYGGGPSNRQKGPWFEGKSRRGGYTPTSEVRNALMGIDWMSQKELCQAIPPAYTEYIAKAFLKSLQPAEVF